MNADHVEPFVTDGGKAVRRCRPDYDYVAGAGNDLFPIDDYCRLTGETSPMPPAPRGATTS